MTFTIRGVHLAIAGAFLAGILIAAGIFFALDGSDDKAQPAQQASSANIDEPPASVPTAAPTATPAPSPTPAPTAAPQIRTCAESRATGTYNSDEERAFFLANCTTQTASGSSPAPSPAPSGSSASATAEEANYRTKAEATLVVMGSKIGQWFDTLGNNAPDAKFLEFGTVLRGFAQELDRLPPPPPRFSQVHVQLKTQLLAMADHIITIQSVTTEKQADAWFKKYFDIAIAMDAALQDYALVIGVQLPPIFTE